MSCPVPDHRSPNLSELREQIEDIDREILGLLQRRMKVVTEVAAYKKRTGTPIRDLAREAQLLANRRAQAIALGLAPEPVESMYRQVMMASRDHQAAQGAAAPSRVVPKDIAIIGGRGEMGRRLQLLFADLGHRVLIVDVDTELRPEQAAARADVVVISVPIAVTGEVIRQVGPHVRPDALLMDITSLKGEVMQTMLAATEASVVGTHPMFGPGVHSLIGQRVVLCRGRGEAWYRWLIEMLEGRGLVVAETAPAEHDRVMALVQVLTHFQTQVLGLSLSRCGISLDESLRLTSPAYLMELYVAARHFAQAPELYGPIEMGNPESEAITRVFCAAARELADVLRAHDQAGFEAIFHEVRRYFGAFTTEAVEQSSFLIDRMIERAMG